MKHINKVVYSKQEPAINTLWIDGNSIKFYDGGWKTIGSTKEDIINLQNQIKGIQASSGDSHITLATKINDLTTQVEEIHSNVGILAGKVNDIDIRINNPSKLEVNNPSKLTLEDINLIMSDLNSRGVISITAKK